MKSFKLFSLLTNMYMKLLILDIHICTVLISSTYYAAYLKIHMQIGQISLHMGPFGLYIFFSCADLNAGWSYRILPKCECTMRQSHTVASVRNGSQKTQDRETLNVKCTVFYLWLESRLSASACYVMCML